jgi:hypothetical protein
VKQQTSWQQTLSDTLCARPVVSKSTSESDRRERFAIAEDLSPEEAVARGYLDAEEYLFYVRGWGLVPCTSNAPWIQDYVPDLRRTERRR